MEDGQFPTQDNCDLERGDEFAVWAMVGIPGMKGAPLPFPVGYLRQVSQRLWDAGFRHHPEVQTIKYQRPRSDSPHWFADPGAWVPIDTPEPDGPSVKEFVQALPQREKAALRTELGLDEPEDN